MIGPRNSIGSRRKKSSAQVFPVALRMLLPALFQQTSPLRRPLFHHYFQLRVNAFDVSKEHFISEICILLHA